MSIRLATVLVLIAAPAAANSLDKEVIRRPIRAANPQISKCYEKQLVTNPKLEGRITVDFTIGVNGKVLDATATGMDATVGACVAGVIRTLQFPRTPAPVRVMYPFTFHR